MTRAMYDSINAARLPADAKLVACYVDGYYANEAAVRARFPHATVVRITVLGHAGAHVADVETGDLTPESGAVWAANEIKAGRQPTLYCNASTWPEVKQHVAAHGIAGKVSYFIANYNGRAEMIPGSVAHQYQERTDQNLDYSVAADYWPGVDPAPVASQAVSEPQPVPAPKPAPQPTPKDDDMALIVKDPRSSAQWVVSTDLSSKTPIADHQSLAALQASSAHQAVALSAAQLDRIPTIDAKA